MQKAKLLNQSQPETVKKISGTTRKPDNNQVENQQPDPKPPTQVQHTNDDVQLKAQKKTNKTAKQLQKNKKETTKNAASTATASSGTFSFFYSMMPKEILGVSLNEIKNDLKESTIQLTSAYVDSIEIIRNELFFF